MSASDALSQQLFHGSYHPFKPGDIVTPQEEDDRAWATTNRKYAGEHVGEDIPGHKDKHGRAPQVFVVEKPEDAVQHAEHKDTYTSKTGFKVVGKT
jgi:hypothetical protein